MSNDPSEIDETAAFADEFGETVLVLDGENIDQDAIDEEMGEVQEGEEGEEGEEGDDLEDVQDDSIQAFFGHTDSVYTVTLHPKLPDLAISGSGDDKAFVWNTSSGDSVFELAGHKDTITCTGVSQDGKLIATGSYDGTVGIWDSSDGKNQRFLDGPGDGIEWLEWHSKGNLLLAGSRDSTAWLWLAGTGACMNVFAGHSGPINCGGFTSDGKQIVTGSDDATVRVWDPKTATAIHTLQGHDFHTEAVISLHTRESLLITGSQDFTAKLSNVAAGRVLGTLPGHTDAVESVGLSSDISLAATGSLDKRILIWDVSRMQTRATCEHDDGVIKVVWHPTQPFLYSASIDGTVRLWDGRTGNSERVWRGHKDIILALAVSQDGQLVVSGSDDHAAMVFKV